MDPDGQQMVGRSTETAGLRSFLDRLPASGGALVLRGEPGIGKSTLLRWAAAQAAVRGVRVIAGAAVEDEAGLPYAGLRLLVDQLPPSGRGGLAETLSAGRPLATVALALLKAVSAPAAEQPVLVVVDDAQWLDRTSWRVLAFVARRLSRDPALVLLAMRDGATTAARLSGSGLAELPVEPLAAEPARELLARRAPGLPAEFAQQVLTQAGGNPLGIVELAAAAPAPNSPATGLPLTIPLVRAFAHVADRLPEPARTLVRVAALNDGPDGDEIVAATRRLEPAVSEEDFGPAVAEGVLEITAGFQVGFRHPLVRSAVRQAAGVDRRRRIHRALSVVVAASPARQIWHRASAASAPDARLAADLADVAAQAHQRGAIDAAAQAYGRAAQLTEDPQTRADLLLSALHAAYEAGDPATVKRLLDRLADHRLTAAAQARYAWIQESVDDDLRSGPEPARHHLDVVEALVRLGESDPALRGVEFQALALFSADPDRATRDRVVRMVRRLPLAEDDPRTLCVLGLVAPLEQAAAVLPVVRQRAIELTAGAAELHLLAQAAFGIGALPTALRLATAAVAALRAQSRHGLLLPALSLQSVLAAQLGNVTLAETAAAGARQLAAETVRPRWAMIADLAAARAAALRGDIRSAQALAGPEPMPGWGRLARGQAAAAAGLFDTAFDDWQALFDPRTPSYHPQLRWWALPFLVEAAMLGDRAEQLAEIIAGLAPLRSTGPPIAQVGLAYADAVLADGQEQYLVALARADLGDWPFELARLQQAYGGWLRRQRRPVEARPLLRSAANTFGVLGATPWAARADAELRASGERTQRGLDARPALTPQELQIAGLAADGLSNREIAARLVLSPRTIDSHLYRAFRKLGVTSRTQLTRLLLPTEPD